MVEIKTIETNSLPQPATWKDSIIWVLSIGALLLFNFLRGIGMGSPILGILWYLKYSLAFFGSALLGYILLDTITTMDILSKRKLDEILKELQKLELDPKIVLITGFIIINTVIGIYCVASILLNKYLGSLAFWVPSILGLWDAKMIEKGHMKFSTIGMVIEILIAIANFFRIKSISSSIRPEAITLMLVLFLKR